MIINAKIKPSSLEDKIEKLDDGTYLISVTERAESGKANVAVIKILSKFFEVSFKKILIKNPKSRKKIVEIDI